MKDRRITCKYEYIVQFFFVFVTYIVGRFILQTETETVEKKTEQKQTTFNNNNDG